MEQQGVEFESSFTSTTTEYSPNTSYDCPLCLESLSSLDCTYTIICIQRCGFNMCIHCILKIRSVSQEDTFIEASDGNLFRLPMKCPNCRSPYHGPLIDDIIYLRNYLLPDNYSSSSSSPSSHSTVSTTTQAFDTSTDSTLAFTSAQMRYYKYKEHGVEEVMKEDISGSQSCDAPSSSDNVDTRGIDKDLLLGLEEAMTLEEQYYITSLMTSGDFNNLAQAAMALHQIAQASRSRVQLLSSHIHQENSSQQTTTSPSPSLGRTVSNRNVTLPPPSMMRSHSLPNTSTGYSNYNRVGRSSISIKSRQDQQRKEEEWKRLHPLPVRLPRAFSLNVDFDPYDKRRTFISFLDDEVTLYSCYHPTNTNTASTHTTDWYNSIDLLKLIQDVYCRLTIKSGSVVIRQPMENVQGVAHLTSSLRNESCTTDTQKKEELSRGDPSGPWWQQSWRFIVEGTGLNTKTIVPLQAPIDDDIQEVTMDKEVQKITVDNDEIQKTTMESQRITPTSSRQVISLDTHTMESSGIGSKNPILVSKHHNSIIPWRRIVVSSVQGPVARLGVRPGDVITHINGDPFTGNAEGLRYLLSSHRGNTVQIVVNADKGVAEALRLRFQFVMKHNESSVDV